MSLKEKIETLNKEINEKIATLNSIKEECEMEKSVHGSLSSRTYAKKKKIETEWKKSISEYNKLQGSIKK
ncbi:MAG: hypothetical protein V4565_11185 [Bacteroidota bacterium]